MDLFESKNIKPMLIGADSEAFDSPDYIYELKLDGDRCIAYLDSDKTDLRNKRNIKMLPKVPELTGIHTQVNRKCILDGELAVIKDGKPNFYEIQRRVLMENPFKIKLASEQNPAFFTAFDIIYLDNRQTTNLPLSERKNLLSSVVKNESPEFAVSRVIEETGIGFYNLTKKQDLEGIVAKRRNSLYYLDKRTKDWIKIKNLKDEDFVVLGYIRKKNDMISLVLGQYKNDELIYKGHVSLGEDGQTFGIISKQSIVNSPPLNLPLGNENAVWITPTLVCTVKYMMKSQSGGMRQPVFKGLRTDKHPRSCIEPKEQR